MSTPAEDGALFERSKRSGAESRWIPLLAVVLALGLPSLANERSEQLSRAWREGSGMSAVWAAVTGKGVTSRPLTVRQAGMSGTSSRSRAEPSWPTFWPRR